MISNRYLLVFAACISAAASSFAAPYHLILSGSGGEEVYQEQFATWGQRLHAALIDHANVTEERIFWLSEDGPFQPTGASDIDLESIENAFRALQTRLRPDDQLFVYVVGHGSFYGSVSKFHIPGVDATAADFARYLDWLPTSNVVLVNTLSSGAAFINVLGKQGRVVISATKGVGEFNATQFMEFFIQSLEDGSADVDRDERISVLEIVRQAAELTAAYYTAEGLIATEHAIIDDNGDGLGSRVFDPASEDHMNAEELDGAKADTVFLRDYVFPDYVPQTLIDAYLAALEDVRALIAKKASIDEAAYYSELETLLLTAARANRAVKEFEELEDIGYLE